MKKPVDYSWKQRPIRVESPAWQVRLCPAGARSELVVQERRAGRWVAVVRDEGTVDEMQRRFEAEMSRRCHRVDDGRAWVCRETGRTWSRLYEQWFGSLAEWQEFWRGRVERHCSQAEEDFASPAEDEPGP